MKLGEEGTFKVLAFFFPNNHYTWSSFPGDGWTPAWQWEVVNKFLLLLFLYVWLLLSLINCPYLNPGVFLLSIFWFSFPSHCGESWASGNVVLSCHLGLNHDRFYVYVVLEFFAFIFILLPKLQLTFLATAKIQVMFLFRRRTIQRSVNYSLKWQGDKNRKKNRFKFSGLCYYKHLDSPSSLWQLLCPTKYS